MSADGKLEEDLARLRDSKIVTTEKMQQEEKAAQVAEAAAAAAALESSRPPPTEPLPPPGSLAPVLPPHFGAVLPTPSSDDLLVRPRAAHAVSTEPPPAPTAPPLRPVEPPPPPPDPATEPLETDERFASLRRSYNDRLVSMAAVFRELPHRLTNDGPLVSLRMCDAPADEVRERAFEIFAEALHSSQEEQVSALHTRLAAKEAETARLGRQLGTLITEQRDGTDVNGRKLAAAEAELRTARARLEQLEAYHSAAASRQLALEDRAKTLEEETLHWRTRCAPLRDRCAELEDEVAITRGERQAERALVENARRVQSEAEAAVISAKAEAVGANQAAREARAQAQAAVADTEGRWLHQGLSVVLSRLFEVLPIGDELQQALYAASNGEEFTKAGAAFCEVVTTHVRGLETDLSSTRAELEVRLAQLEENADELEKARHTASMASEHAHQLVERTLAAEQEAHQIAIEKACKAAKEAREAAEKEAERLASELSAAQDERLAFAAKAKVNYEAALDERSQQFAKDMRTLTASYRDARTELTTQAEQLREARRLKQEAEKALHAGLEQAMSRVDAAEARLREQSYLAAQLASHASTSLQQEMLAIFGARDMLTNAAAVGGAPPSTGHAALGACTPTARASAPLLTPSGASVLTAASPSATPEMRTRSVHAEAVLQMSNAAAELHAAAGGAGGTSSGVESGGAPMGPVPGGVPRERRAPIAGTALLASIAPP